MATAIRASSGGLPHVKAMAVALPARGLVQVSMNLTRVDAFERGYILRALAAHQGNISRTADALGVERSNLYKKMRAFGIAPSRRELE